MYSAKYSKKIHRKIHVIYVRVYVYICPLQIIYILVVYGLVIDIPISRQKIPIFLYYYPFILFCPLKTLAYSKYYYSLPEFLKSISEIYSQYRFYEKPGIRTQMVYRQKFQPIPIDNMTTDNDISQSVIFYIGVWTNDYFKVCQLCKIRIKESPKITRILKLELFRLYVWGRFCSGTWDYDNTLRSKGAILNY
eukprot:TRINITY_DN3339_c1_g1_i2.p2 TRINITY_DN3339_c1_g1~~TRINITY_DN3339_c1_g1_i2.p2  ORF type:complete len:214 (+),score=-16.98 TRINITY_DN3339_c1_g1_i2:64-642(+)